MTIKSTRRRIAFAVAPLLLAATAITVTSGANPAGAAPAPGPRMPAKRQMEYLDRGLVAVKVPDGVYLSWRLLGDEPDDTTFSIRRDGGPLAVVRGQTNYLDPTGTPESSYRVFAAAGHIARAPSKTVTPLADQYLDVDLQRPAPAITPVLAPASPTITGKQFEPVDMDLLRRIRDANGTTAGLTLVEFDALIAPFRTYFADQTWAPRQPFGTPDTRVGPDRYRLSTALYQELTVAFRRYVDELDRGPKLPYARNADGSLATITSTYTPGDASVGDVDGDGSYELFLKWDPTENRDSSQYGFTAPAVIDCYRLDGTLLWRVNVGYNIRAGAHDTQLVVYDFNGDGRAEMIIKTANGTTSGVVRDGEYLVRDVIGDRNATAEKIQEYLASGDTASLERYHDAMNKYTVGWVLPGGNTPVEQNVRQWGKIYTYGPIGESDEYLTAFDGRTGRVLDTVRYAFPNGPESWGAAPVDHRGAPFFGQVDPYWEDPATRWGYYPWGDHQGNRANRFLAGVGYLDGVHPSAIMARGYYARTTLAAYSMRGHKLVLGRTFDSAALPPEQRLLAEERGNHWMSVADVDGDRRDEIVYGALVMDDDLTVKAVAATWFPYPEPPTNVDLAVQMHNPDADDRYVPLSHGDALHVGDFNPDRPGVEVFLPTEANYTEYGLDRAGNRVRGYRPGAATYDPVTGEVLTGTYGGRDIGRGVAENIDPNSPGAEYWASVPGASSVYVYSAATGERLYQAPLPINFLVYWDGDLTRELLDSNRIAKADTGYQARPAEVAVTNLLVADGATSINGTKATPVISADLFGDWREEVVWRLGDDAVRIYTTTVPTRYEIRTLMHDPQYRSQVAGQNSTYNQPPHPSFYLDPAYPLPPRRSDIDVTRKA